jgi:site-specific recombinase XerD
MVKASGVLPSGPLVVFADGYRFYLDQRGYSPRAVRERLELLGQLSLWLVAQGLSAEELTPAQAQRFFAARQAAGQRRVPTLRTLALLFDYLRDERVLPVERAQATRLEELLARYGRYLEHDRGLAPLTIVRYQRMARRFLAGRVSQDGGEIGTEGLDAAEVHCYLLGCRSRLVIESVKREAADLRSLLRFLYSQGLTATDLGSAMPPVAGWRDTRLPATMSATQVAAVLGSCDRSRSGGLRDYAILSLLGRLGLRSGEVAALRLTDIDWRAGEIWVRGKARRDDRLPLTVDVGKAIASYLRDGRPPSPCPSVILTRYAPFRGIHPSSITRVVYRACERAGLSPVGGHRLRHALATEMLRQGSNLLEISQVLRHRDLATTSAYAKLDRAALRTVTRSWPGAGR